MAITDFLFNGSPPPSTTTYGSTTTALPPWLESYYQGLVGKSNVVAGEPYQPYTGPRIAGFTPDQMSAFNQTRNNQDSWQPSFNVAAGNLNDAGAGPGAFDSGMGFINQAASGPSASGAIAPYLGAASQTWPGASAAYMSPYTDSVVNRIGELGTRNLTENMLPGVNDIFTKAGQFGSSRHGDFTLRALRDANESTLGQQSQALEQGYGTAANIFGQDMSRQGQLAGIAGSAAGTDMNALTSMGATAGNLASADVSNNVNLANANQTLGTNTSQAGLRDAASMEAIGQTQQGQTQKNLDTGYNDFLEQRNYPRDMVAFMNSAIRGLPTPTSTTSTATGPTGAYQPSPLSQLLGYGVGLSQLLKMKRGGPVPARKIAYPDGAPVRRGGYMRKAA